MQLFLKKNWIKGVVCLLLLTFCNLPLQAAHKRHRINIHRGAYTFKSSYTLHTPSSSTELPIDLILEYDRALLEYMNLQFTLDGISRVVRIVRDRPCITKHTMYRPKRYNVYRPNGISSSIWYPAIEKLAFQLGDQCYGKHQFKKIPLSNMNLNQSASYIYLKPSKKFILTTKDMLTTYSTVMPTYLESKTTVQSEIDISGNKRITAVISFTDKPPTGAPNDFSIMKFAYTKKGLQLVSEEWVDPSSIWYSTIKKVVQRNVSRYLRLRNRHNRITRAVEIHGSSQNKK